MLSSAPSPTESTDSDSAPPVGQDPPAPAAPKPELQFSELIDRWLQEGDRLNAQAGEPVDQPAPPVSKLQRWRGRAIEIARPIVERHRLELLIAIGLLPLMLFLITQSGGQRQTPPPAPVRAAAPAPARGPIAARPAPKALLSEGLLRQCTAGPRITAPAPAPARHAVAHRHKHVVRRTAHARPPAATASRKSGSRKPVPRKPPPAPRRR